MLEKLSLWIYFFRLWIYIFWLKYAWTQKASKEASNLGLKVWKIEFLWHKKTTLKDLKLSNLGPKYSNWFKPLIHCNRPIFAVSKITLPQIVGRFAVRGKIRGYRTTINPTLCIFSKPSQMNRDEIQDKRFSHLIGLRRWVECWFILNVYAIFNLHRKLLFWKIKDINFFFSSISLCCLNLNILSNCC